MTDVVGNSSSNSSSRNTRDAQHITRPVTKEGSDSMLRVEDKLEDESLDEPVNEAEELLDNGPERALVVLSRQNCLRRAAAVVVTSKLFEWVVLALILANCVTLAMYSHQPGFDETQLGQALVYADYVFAVCFSFELVMKVMAMGLVLQPGTYLRDGWNMLDAAVVVLGWVDIALSGDEYLFLRTARVLRPLRTITHIKGLKVPVATLAKALPMLLDVLALCLFLFFVFGVVAVQLFAGVLRNRCAAADFSYAYLVPAAGAPGHQQVYANVTYQQLADGSVQQCSGYLATDITWTMEANAPNSSSNSSLGQPVWSGGSPGDGWSCPGQPQQYAPFGTFCAALGNPNNGMTSFDTIVWAWVTIFQCITTEGYTDIMYALQDAVSPWVLVYFVLLIVFGSFFLVNLALAVLYLQFTKEFSVTPAASRTVSTAASAAASRNAHLADTKELQQTGRDWQPIRSGSSSRAGASCLQQPVQPNQDPTARLPQVDGMQIIGNQAVSQMAETQQQPQWQQQEQAGLRQPPRCSDADGELPGACQDLPAGPNRLPPLSSNITWGCFAPETAAVGCDVGMLQGSVSGSGSAQSPAENAAEQDFVTAKVIISRRTGSGKALPAGHKQHAAEGHPGRAAAQQSPRTILKHSKVEQQQQQPAPQQPAVRAQQRSHWQLKLLASLHRCLKPFAAAGLALSQRCRALLKSGWVEIVSLVVIITNTAVMASASYPGNPKWQEASDMLNVAFCFYFVLELLVKLLGSGFRVFVRDRMNQFDALVVAASLVEVVMFLLPGDETSSSSLSVLRTARLLRVFKLARSWAELNRIITTILKSFSQVMYLSLLLLLFVWVFALMGMQLFGFKFSDCSLPGSQQLCPPGTPPSQCPVYPDCYIPCKNTEVFTWIKAVGSPYNDMAYCEQFPRNSSFWGNATAASQAAAAAPAGVFQYWAQVGKAVVPESRFDNIGWAVLTVFQCITTENWNNVAYNAMAATSPAAYLWFVVIIVLGNYILLNLFLAILLESFGSSSGTSGGASSMNSVGGSLAAAAKVAQLLAWMQELLEGSWFAKVLRRRNRVAALQDGSETDVGAGETPPGMQASTRPQPVVAFDEASGDGSGPVLPRGSAFLVGDAEGSLIPYATARKTSIAGGYPAAAPHRRSFSPLVAPSKRFDNLQSLTAARQPSFLGARAHSVMGQAPGGMTTVSRSSQSCIINRSFGGSKAGHDAAVSNAEHAKQEGMVGAPGGVSGRQLGSLSSHRLASAAGQGVADADMPVPPGSRIEEQQHEPLPGEVVQAADGAAFELPAAAAGMDILQAALPYPCLDGLSSSSGLSPPSGLTPRRPLCGRSCLLFAPDSCLRMQLHKLLLHPYFEQAILVLIFASSVALALDMPHLDPTGPFKRALEALDCVFAILFLIEAVIKAVVHGFAFNGAGSYLRNPWNVLDFVIVVIGVVVMGSTLSGLHRQQSLSSVKALRTLRALRPLRVASRLQGMKVVVNSLFASLPALGNVLLVCLLFYLIFGIMAVDLLGGSLYSCQDPSGQLYDADYVLPAGQYITRDWCLNSSLTVTTSAYHSAINVTIPSFTPQREWVKPVANYDNILLATFTLWQISTTELWVDTMYTAIAAVGEDQQPRPGHNPVLALFFIAFIVFGGFFVLQLFVSVTIEKFSEMHQQQGKSALLTPQQEDWLRIERMMADIDLQVKHQPPRQAWRLPVFALVASRQFEMVVMAAIVVNCLIMAMTHADMTTVWQDFMSWANLAFTVFFALEIVVKFVALGFKPVLRDAWCRFDIIVVAVSIIGVGIDLGTPSNLQFLPLIRVLRVVRIFRLVPKAEGLRVLLRTLLMSLPALGNIVSVLGLFFFIYAVIGMTLWGAVKHGQYLTRHANFHHVGMALLTLFRMITGESWDGIMQDCLLTSMCLEVVKDVALPTTVAGAGGSITAGTWLDPSDALLQQLPSEAVVNRCSPSPIAAVIYFCSFVLLCGLVLVNFVIGVIIDNFQSSCQSDDLSISKASVEHFAQVWSELDPHATHFIPAIQLSTLIQQLRPPLGVNGEQDARSKIQAIIMTVDIPIRHGKIHFLETMHALAGRIAGTAVPEDEEQKVRRMLYPRLPSKDAADIPKYGVSHFYAALYVQAAVRGFLKRHALKEGRSTYSSMAGASAAGQAQQQQRRRSAQWQWLLAPRGAPAEPAAGSTHQHQQQQEGRTQEATQLHLEPRTDAG